MDQVATVKNILIYPVKSCGLISLKTARIGPYGFINDRYWAVVRETGRFVSQREYPKMALITPLLDETFLHLLAPGMPRISIPLSKKEPNSDKTRVKVWSTVGMGYDEGDEVSYWLQKYLQKDGLRLKRLAEPTRDIDPNLRARHVTSINKISFADSAPFLLVSEGGIQSLIKNLPKENSGIDFRRFRPNILISGGDGLVEDKWSKIRIGKVTFDMVGPCERCKVTTINPETGEFVGPEPLKTLNEKADGPGLFGHLMTHSSNCEGEHIEVGMAVYAEQKRKED